MKRIICICAVVVMTVQVCLFPALSTAETKQTSPAYFARLETQQEGETKVKTKSPAPESRGDQDTEQSWFSKYKWWILAGVVVIAGGAAAAGGGGGGGGGGNSGDSGKPSTTGTYTATW